MTAEETLNKIEPLPETLDEIESQISCCLAERFQQIHSDSELKWEYAERCLTAFKQKHTLSIIKKAVGEFRAYNREGREWGWTDADNAAEDILSRVKSELGVE